MEYTTRHLYFLGILTSLYYSINITGKWRKQYSFQERAFKGHSGELPLRLLLGLGSFFMRTSIGHFRVTLCLCFKTSPDAQGFLTRSFSCKSNSFQHGWFCTRTRFETKRNSNLIMVYSCPVLYYSIIEHLLTAAIHCHWWRSLRT